MKLSPTSACIIGIDPGTDTMGVGVIVFDIYTLNILETRSLTLQAAKEKPKTWMDDYRPDRLLRLDYLSESLYRIFESFNPLIVTAEDNFISLRRPQAYGALVQSVAAVQNALNKHNSSKPLYMVSPIEVKNAVGAAVKDKKLGVKQAIVGNPIFNYQPVIQVSELSEHEYDAIAVAYHRYLCLRHDFFYMDQ